jgi:hypothetical protein
MKPSDTMVNLVDALVRACASRVGQQRKMATARAALFTAIVGLERQVHDLRNDVFKATGTLELAQIQAAQDLEQLADALAMPRSATFAEVLERVRSCR